MTNWNHDRPDPNTPDGLEKERLGDHQRFVELCALSTAGSLTEDEASELEVHLEKCQECREAMAGFRFIAVEGASVLLPDEAEIDENASQQAARLPWVAFMSHPWNQERAKGVFLARIGEEVSARRNPLSPARNLNSAPPVPGVLASMPWHRKLQYVGAAIVLLAAFAVAGYRFGSVHGRATEGRRVETEAQLLSARSALEEQLNSRTASMDEVSRELDDQTRIVRELKRQLAAAQSAEKDHQSEISSTVAQNSAIASERDSLLGKLKDAETSRASLQAALEGLQAERRDDLLRISSLEVRLDQLNGRLKESQETVAQQQDFLVSDRDIRELMGARSLYITDVVDVDKNGRTRKPFGRVFYTKGKSLVFYAFDLDQQRGFQNAAFQLWGQRGSDRNSAVNMGIFYLDNEANRRWVLKFDDPEKLAQINAVFVTVEPTGGSEKPAGKQLLYASLRTLPNHP